MAEKNTWLPKVTVSYKQDYPVFKENLTRSGSVKVPPVGVFDRTTYVSPMSIISLDISGVKNVSLVFLQMVGSQNTFLTRNYMTKLSRRGKMTYRLSI